MKTTGEIIKKILTSKKWRIEFPNLVKASEHLPEISLKVRRTKSTFELRSRQLNDDRAAYMLAELNLKTALREQADAYINDASELVKRKAAVGK